MYIFVTHKQENKKIKKDINVMQSVSFNHQQEAEHHFKDQTYSYFT